MTEEEYRKQMVKAAINRNILFGMAMLLVALMWVFEVVKFMIRG